MSRSGEMRRYSAKAPFVGSPGLEPWRAAHTRIAEYEIRLRALSNVHNDTCKLNENEVGVLMSLGMSAKAVILTSTVPGRSAGRSTASAIRGSPSWPSIIVCCELGSSVASCIEGIVQAGIRAQPGEQRNRLASVVD